MRKYINLIVLTIFIVVMLGYFYTDANNVTRNYPTFQIKNISGDEEIVKDLMITGDFSFGFFGYESFRVDSEGTSYYRDEPFLKRLKGYYGHIDLERLQKEYRSFMRGKDPFSSYFHETNELLAYVSVPVDVWSLQNDEFEIAVLNKQTNDSTSFRVPIPNRSNYSYIDIRHVYLVGTDVYFITQNEQMADNGSMSKSDFHVYTFDTEREELIGNEMVGELEYSNSDNGYSHIDILIDDQSEEGSIILFDSEITYVNETEEEMYGETVHINKMMKYNIVTKAKEEIDLVDNELGVPIAILGSELYFANIEQNTMGIIAYDIEKSAVVGQLDVQTGATYLTYHELFHPPVKEGKLYFVPSSTEGEAATVSVIDLEGLELVYEGEVALVEPLDSNRNVSIYINQVELKK